MTIKDWKSSKISPAEYDQLSVLGCQKEVNSHAQDQKMIVYTKLELSEGKVFSLTITPRNNDEEFLFLCNPCNEILDFKIPESCNAYETILPPMNHLNSSKELKPWHYFLLARKLSP